MKKELYWLSFVCILIGLWLFGCSGSDSDDGDTEDVVIVPVEVAEVTAGSISAYFSGTATLEAEEEYEDAVAAYKQSAQMLEALGENDMAMYVWQAISRLRASQGQYLAAIGAYEEGVENMPKGSFKKTILQKILGAPGKFIGNNDSQEEAE